jgi:hypothetical protein
VTPTNRNKKVKDKDLAFSEEDIIPYEKWLVAFKNNNSKRFSRGSLFLRQFYAPGFYEAYDMVATYSEKFLVEVLWFKEKRNCGYPYLYQNYPQLESLCTYCNAMFNHIEPIPCSKTNCFAEFCSKECVLNHYNIRHKK